MIKPHQKNRAKALGGGFLVSSFFSLGFATALSWINIPLNVVLPTTAPIWVGITTLVFMLLLED